MLGPLRQRTAQKAVVRSFSGFVQKELKLLIVDGYAVKSRKEFVDLGLPYASTLYREMIHRQTPRGVIVEFDTIFPCDPDFKMPDAYKLMQYDGCAFTGSSYSAYDPAEDVKVQLELFTRSLECGVSMFGSCWGLQVAAMAMGGLVELNPKGREVGVGRGISLTQRGNGHPLFAGKKGVFEAFMSHSDEVTRVPDNALVLAGNDHTSVQAMGVVHKGVESWFVQYHPEYNLNYYARLIASRHERMVSMGFFSDRDEVNAYVEDLLVLHEDPNRKDLRWKYGISNDIIDADIKEAEVRNWVKYLMSMK